MQTQPFRILAELLGQRGEIVSREDLRNALWGEDTFVEFDHGINTAMQKIRRTLNDSAANPRFVETVPRRGYRFIAPVRFSDHKRLRQNHTEGLRGPHSTVARIAALVERGLMFLQPGRNNSAG